MKIKKFALTAAMMLLMVFAISGVAENSYAYWASNVTPPTNVDTSGTVGIGTFTMGTPTYDPNTVYSIGDVVEYNGIFYTAKKDGILKTPGVDGGWKSDWQQN